MIESVLEDVKQYVYANADIEACGLISVEKGRVRWNPCPNVAENPKHDFIIDRSIKLALNILHNLSIYLSTSKGH